MRSGCSCKSSKSVEVESYKKYYRDGRLGSMSSSERRNGFDQGQVQVQVRLQGNGVSKDVESSPVLQKTRLKLQKTNSQTLKARGSPNNSQCNLRHTG